VIEHKFNGPPFTIGIEEELMILDGETYDLANEVESILAALPPELEGQVKPELIASVLEIATLPCADVAAAGEELRELRRGVAAIAERQGLALGGAGTHPFALWEEQEIVDRPRYRELAAELGWIARRELIFGTHVHIGIEGADRAIYVADGLRRYIPLLLALSANSPFWRGVPTGMRSSRVPVFRGFPRVGVPPHYGNWETYSNRVGTMMRSGAIEDYTFLWWDVRPHPNLGTVETRVYDQLTNVDHTVSLAALTACLAHRMCSFHDAGEPLVEFPTELIDDNKVRAAIVGLDGELIDYREGRLMPARALVDRLLPALAASAEELGCTEELEGIADICEHGTGAKRQLAIWEEHGDLRHLVAEIIEKTKA
jgi:carboxylate-amine ligase